MGQVLEIGGRKAGLLGGGLVELAGVDEVLDALEDGEEDGGEAGDEGEEEEVLTL